MRHPHKGRLSRRESLKGVPFVYMNEQEFEESMDEASRDIDQGILEEARRGQVGLVVAAIFLESTGQPDRLVIYDAEYGDGEGKSRMLEFARGAVRKGLLKPEERLRAEVLTIELERTS